MLTAILLFCILIIPAGTLGVWWRNKYKQKKKQEAEEQNAERKKYLLLYVQEKRQKDVKLYPSVFKTEEDWNNRKSESQRKNQK